MVQAVRQETRNVKLVLENCSARTVSALEQAKTADKAFVDIVGRTSQITQRAQKVAGSVEEQGHATAEVTRGIKAVEEIARQNTSEAERLLETISTLEDLSRELNSSVDRFLASDGVGSELSRTQLVSHRPAEAMETVMQFAE